MLTDVLQMFAESSLKSLSWLTEMSLFLMWSGTKTRIPCGEKTWKIPQKYNEKVCKRWAHKQKRWETTSYFNAAERRQQATRMTKWLLKTVQKDTRSAACSVQSSRVDARNKVYERRKGKRAKCQSFLLFSSLLFWQRHHLSGLGTSLPHHHLSRTRRV